MHSLPEIRTGDVDWSAWLTGAKDRSGAFQLTRLHTLQSSR
jgi:hypothetical protein